MHSQECGQFFCFCLSLEPDQEELDSDAAETRATSVTGGVLIESNLTQMLSLSPKKVKVCFLIKGGGGENV